MSNIVVYTAAFGKRDEIAPLDHKILAQTHAKFVAYMDESSPQVYDAMTEKTKRWCRGPSLFNELLRHSDSRHLARYHKALSFTLFPDADYTIWMDAHVQLLMTPERIISETMRPMALNENRMIGAFRHCLRSTVEQEADTVVACSMDSRAIVDDALAAYQQDGCPEELRLAETPVVIRKRCSEVQAFETYWFQELNNRSVRDQISFPYCCWKAGIQWTEIPGTRKRNKYFRMRR